MVSFKSLAALATLLFAVTASASPVLPTSAAPLVPRAPLHARAALSVGELAAPEYGLTDSGSNGGKTYWSTFSPGTTACGQTYGPNEVDNLHVAGVPAALFQNGAQCGQKVYVVFANSHRITATIVDTCSDCDLLLSKAAFEASGSPTSVGFLTNVRASLTPIQ